MTLANRITIFRIILVPVFIFCIQYRFFNIALTVFTVAALSDALDGYIARAYNQKTQFGTIVDPLADKLLIISAFISLSMSADLPAGYKIPAYVTIVVLSRDVFLLIGSAVTLMLLGKINIKPIFIGKCTTFFQMLTIIFVLSKWPYIYVVWDLMLIFTVISGVRYMMEGLKELHEKN